MKRTVIATSLLLCSMTAFAQLKAADVPEANATWKKVRASLFAGKPIATAAPGAIEIDAPVRAEDAAIVPIAIRTRLPQRVDKLYIVIDSNPSPVSAIVQFAALAGRADLETRVRINDYTHVRAIAELADGSLQMASRYVKAAGGCSAPPAKEAAAMAALGKMKIRVDGKAGSEHPVLAQVMINHPNDSGFAVDPTTKQATPAHYVRQVSVTYGGKPVLSADLDFSISENPNFRFWFVPAGEGELRAEVIDSNDLRFESALALSSAN
jgi:sulfur-oxidizing protein SoxY